MLGALVSSREYIAHKAALIEERFEKLLCSLAADPHKHGTLHSYADHGNTIATLDSDIGSLRAKLEKIDSSRARVWRLDDAGLIEPLEIAKRLNNLKERAAGIQTRIVAKLQQRTLCLASEQESIDVRELCQTASAGYAEGDFQARVDITRAVISSLGGLRVTAAGNLIAGIGKHATPQEKVKKYEPSFWVNKPRFKGKFISREAASNNPHAYTNTSRADAQKSRDR
jgi:hypothetical protein